MGHKLERLKGRTRKPIILIMKAQDFGREHMEHEFLDMSAQVSDYELKKGHKRKVSGVKWKTADKKAIIIKMNARIFKEVLKKTKIHKCLDLKNWNVICRLKKLSEKLSWY